jgi:hypothetical protein
MQTRATLDEWEQPYVDARRTPPIEICFTDKM